MSEYAAIIALWLGIAMGLCSGVLLGLLLPGAKRGSNPFPPLGRPKPTLFRGEGE